jgi:protein SCO1/2
MLGFALTCTFVRADAPVPPPPQQKILNSVGVDQNLGEQLPLDLKFRDESGRDVALRDYFHGRPVLMTFVYYECPMLCTLTLNQLTRSLNALSESAGESFDIVTISFDPKEGPELARKKKQTYLKAYRRPSAADGWHFLTGSQESIDAITKVCGFKYAWDAENKVFAHASVVMAVTPEGQISKYFLDTDIPSLDVRAALNDAVSGKVGKPSPQILFYCFKYDPTTGKYGLIISRALKVLGSITIVAIATLILSLNFIHNRRLRAQAVAQGDAPVSSQERSRT